ncbi:MAG: DNA gyrase inhibitor YacG [Proteobacteria bacterium]|nr:DNA gyrase inhibitor YacG [Pseudomonadota bacterium]
MPLKKAKCPACAKPAVAAYQPFCSKRCSNLDLGRWLDGSYRIPTNETIDAAAFAEGDDEDH